MSEEANIGRDWILKERDAVEALIVSMPEAKRDKYRAASKPHRALAEFDALVVERDEAQRMNRQVVADRAAIVAECDRYRKSELLAGSELDWLIGYLSETDEHAAEHARRARVALAESA
jgi:hypothetical protein